MNRQTMAVLLTLCCFFLLSCGGSSSVDENTDSDVTAANDSDTFSDHDIAAGDFDDEADETPEAEEHEDDTTDESSDSDTAGDPFDCETTADCQEHERTEGFLCSAYRCIPCETDDACRTDTVFGEFGKCENGRCAVFPGCIDTGCEDGEVCDEATRECRPPIDCDDDICLSHQECEDTGSDTDDLCLSSCTQGYVWDEIDESCVQVKTNCQPGRENSLFEQCRDGHRQCVETTDGASCETCLDGYRETSGNCVLIQTCDTLDCAVENRICVSGSGDEDAVCSICLGGYGEVVWPGNSDFSDSDADAAPWTVSAGASLVTGDHHDFSNYIVIPAGESVAQTATSGTVTADTLSVRFATESLSGIVGDTASIRIAINGSSLYENTVTSYDGVVEKTFDISSVDVTSVTVGTLTGGNTAITVDWVRLYGGTPGDGSCLILRGTTCDPPPADNSIAERCDQEHKECTQVNSSRAACGDCLVGFSDVDGRCERTVTCAMLDCESEHRICSEDPNGHCGACLSGFTEDPDTGICVCDGDDEIADPGTGVCEQIVTCADLSCLPDETCIEHTDSTHAVCSRCDEGAAWDAYNEQCVPCPLCVSPGQTGRLYPETSREGHCVCETNTGYFHSSSAPVGTRKCDADGDGWITEEARSAINSPEDSADRVNARCPLRYIDRIRLVNELGESKTVRIRDIKDIGVSKIPLYEPKNRDVATFLVDDADYTKASNYAPKYGSTGLLFTASELNPMTRACPMTDANARETDYNANGVFDVDEKGWNAENLSGVADQVFTMFSYYMELHRGWYEHDKTRPYGTYVIEEKQRSKFAGNGFSVPFTYGDDIGLYWRNCLRWRDAAYVSTSDTLPYGFDFAQYSDRDRCTPGEPGSWCGMHHHSQFKCMVLLADGEEPDENFPHHVESVNSDEYIINECGSTETVNNSVTPGVPNPVDRQISCTEVDSVSDTSLVWVAAKYLPYDDPADYTRGCISECTDTELLPTDMQCSAGAECRDAEYAANMPDFGRLKCFKPLDMIDIYTNTTFVMGTPADQGTYDPGTPGDDTDDIVWKDSDEVPHDVTLTHHFFIAQTETTADQFSDIMGYNPSVFGCRNAVCPVENVSFYDALAFANAYSAREGSDACYDLANLVCSDGNQNTTDMCDGQGGIQSADVTLADALSSVQECDGYRLPTEAEWEYAAGSGYEEPFYDDRTFFIGDISSFDCSEDMALNQIGWYCGNSETDAQLRTHPVAMLRATDWGLFDMNGNVAEWVWDSHTETLTDAVDPAVTGGSGRVVRGGHYESTVQECRTSSRKSADPSQKTGRIGFRLVETMH